jgi:hypothetical protein
MCSRTVCRTCRKITWSGCGRHVASVMQGVRPEDRCTCGQTKQASSSNSAIDCKDGVCRTGPTGGDASGKK